MEPCPSIPSVPNRVHPWIQTHVHPSTHTNCHLLPCIPWFNPPPNPIPLNPCPSVFIRGEKTPRPLPSFRVIRVFRGSNNTPIHPWSSVFIRGLKTTTESNRLRWNFALPKKPPLIPCLPWFQKHPETVPKILIFGISRSGHPQQPRNFFRSGRFRTAKTSVFARAILEQLAQPG